MTLEIILVLGCQSPEIRSERVRRAVRYYRSKTITSDEVPPDIKIIFSGGRGTDTTPSEGELMRKEFLELYPRIDSRKMGVEERSVNTIENFEFSRRIIDMFLMASTTFRVPYVVTVITSSFHAKRAYIIGLSIIGKNVNVIHTNEKVSEEAYIRELTLMNDWLDNKLLITQDVV